MCVCVTCTRYVRLSAAAAHIKPAATLADVDGGERERESDPVAMAMQSAFSGSDRPGGATSVRSHLHNKDLSENTQSYMCLRRQTETNTHREVTLENRGKLI